MKKLSQPIIEIDPMSAVKDIKQQQVLDDLKIIIEKHSSIMCFDNSHEYRIEDNMLDELLTDLLNYIINRR